VLASAVAFPDLVLAVHILGVVVGFGATFAYPIFFTAGARLDPRAMPWFFRIMQLLTRRLIHPGLFIVLVCGIYLASKEDQFHAFYVQWGFFAVIVIGGVEGAVMAPRVRRLIGIAERDLAAVAAGPGAASSPFAFSPEYQKIFSQVSIGGAVQALVVVLTVFFMATHAGA
jgi:uncharacterized membrane protein AbrB (regulator of aidB expression)